MYLSNGHDNYLSCLVSVVQYFCPPNFAQCMKHTVLNKLHYMSSLAVSILKLGYGCEWTWCMW